MNPAEVATSLMIERTLSESTAYRKIDDSLYTVKQGSTYVLINVGALEQGRGRGPLRRPAGQGRWPWTARWRSSSWS